MLNNNNNSRIADQISNTEKEPLLEQIRYNNLLMQIKTLKKELKDLNLNLNLYQ